MLSGHIYIFISIAALVISYLLFYQVAGSMSLQKINMISWVFYYQLFLHCFIGSTLVVYNIDNHYLIHYIVNEQVRIYGWLAVLYTMIAMPTGMLIAKKIFNITSIKFLLKRYIKSPISTYISVKDNYIRILLYVLSGFSFLVVIYTIITVGGSGLQSILYSVDPEVLARQRIEAGREFGGNIYLRNIFGITLTPILTYIAYAYWKITKSRNDLIWFLFLLLLSLIITTYNLEKSPIFTFLIGFSLINVLIKGNLKLKNIIIIIPLVLAILIFLYTSIMGLDSIEKILFSYNTGLTGRIVLGQIAGLFLSLDIFPSLHEHLGFSSLSNLISFLFSIENTDRAARIIMETTNPEGVRLGIAGVINSLFIAEAWANFGLLGVIVSPLYVGFLIQTFYILILKTKKTPVLLGAYAYLSLKWPVNGGFNDFIYNGGLLTLICLFFLIVKLASVLKIISRKI